MWQRESQALKNWVRPGQQVAEKANHTKLRACHYYCYYCARDLLCVFPFYNQESLSSWWKRNRWVHCSKTSLEDIVRKTEGQFVVLLKCVHKCASARPECMSIWKRMDTVHGKRIVHMQWLPWYTTPAGHCSSCLPNIHFASLDNMILIYIKFPSFTLGPYVLGGADFTLLQDKACDPDLAKWSITTQWTRCRDGCMT